MQGSESAPTASDEWGTVSLDDPPGGVAPPAYLAPGPISFGGAEAGHSHSHAHDKPQDKHGGHSHSHGKSKDKHGGHSHSHGKSKDKHGGHSHSHGGKDSKHKDKHSHGSKHGHSHSHGHSHHRDDDDVDVDHDECGHGHSHGASSSGACRWLMDTARDISDGFFYTRTMLLSFARSVSREEENRSLLVFLGLRVAWLLGITVYASYVGSLALRAFSYQAFMEVLQLLIRLATVHFRKQPVSESWSYGSARTEVVMRFAGSIYGLFYAMVILFEAFEHLTEAPHHDSGATSTLVVILAGLLLNVLSVVFIRKHILGGRGEHRQHFVSFVQRNFRGLLLENTPCLLLLLGVWLAELGVAAADSVTAAAIALLTFYVCSPVCVDMARILLLASPATIKDVLYRTLKEASHVEGVLETCDEHFWANAPGDFVGTLTVRVNAQADECVVLERVTQMFSHIVSDLTIQVVKSQWQPT